MRQRWLPARALTVCLCAAALVGCAGDVDNPDDSPCKVALVFTPDPAEASPTAPVRAMAQVTGYAGGTTFQWKVTHEGGDVPITRSADGSAIDFPVLSAGVYQVALESPGSGCPGASANFNVAAPGTITQAYRLRITPPPGAAAVGQIVPYVDRSNADTSQQALVLSPGIDASGQVRVNGAATAASLRFCAPGSVEPLAEVAASSTGRFTLRLEAVSYDVLVVPAGGAAPMRFANWPAQGGQVFDVGAGVPVGGTVRDPAGAPLAGARVALQVDGVPSTVATSAADGSFTLQARGGAVVQLAVTPPAGRGLPQLLGTSTALDLGLPLQIQYAAGLMTRDLSGLLVTQGGSAAPQVGVVVVGAIGAAASAVAGGTLELQGHLRVAAQTGADGRLGAALVPRAALSAVLQAPTGELAVHPLDTRVAPPVALDLGAPPQISGVVMLSQGPADGAQIRLEPQGALAQAGIPTTVSTTGASGAFSLPAAHGGAYQVVLTDPRWRGLPVRVAVTAPAALGPRTLAPRFVLASKIVISNVSSPVVGAVVELLCHACTGVERQRPISGAVSDASGEFLLAVPRRGQ